MPDRDACATELATAMQRAPVATKSKLLEILGAVQGKQSLATIATAVNGNNDALIDTGTRVLGDWMTVDAAPVLFDVASNSKVDKKYQIRALRGYIRYMRQFPMPMRDRAEMCQKALGAASRADEQQLVLEVLERYPSGDTLRLASKAVAIPAVKQDANRVVAAIAQKLGGPSANVQDMLAKAGREPVKVEILKAVYGSGDQQKDVTEQMQNFVGSSRWSVCRRRRTREFRRRSGSQREESVARGVPHRQSRGRRVARRECADRTADSKIGNSIGKLLRHNLLAANGSASTTA